MADQLMEVISGASHGSYSFVQDNFIYRINKFTNKRVYLSCRLARCKGAGKGVKGASRGEVYNFKLTKTHNHPPEENKIRIFEVKQYVREEARISDDTSKEIYERAVQQFNCYDLSRSAVDGLVKRSRERSVTDAKPRSRGWNRKQKSSARRREPDLKTVQSFLSDHEEVYYEEADDVEEIAEEVEEVAEDVEEVAEEEFGEEIDQAAIVEIIQTEEQPVVYVNEKNIICFKEENDAVPGVIVSPVHHEDEAINFTVEPSTSNQEFAYSSSDSECTSSSDDLDEEMYPAKRFRRDSPNTTSELQPPITSKQFSSNVPKRHLNAETEDEDVGDKPESIEKALLKIFSTSYFRDKENVFSLLSDPSIAINENDDGSHMYNSSNSLNIIKSASKLCRFAAVKASQMRNLLIGKTRELNELEDVMIKHFSSSMCFSGSEFFEKCFGESLREAIEDGTKYGMKSKHAWNEEEIVERGSDRRMQLAVALQCYSGKAYSALGEIIDLPGPHITRKWATNFDGYPGFTGQAFSAIRDLVNSRKLETIYVCLSMEDVPLKTAVEIVDDQLFGFTDLGYGRVESDSIPEASRAVVFHATAVNSHWKVPLGYCLVDYLSPQVRANLVCQYVSKLDFCGVKCVGVVLNESVTSHRIFEEFGVYLKGALPQGAFHTYTDEKIRASPFVDTIELMHSLKFLLKEKKVFSLPNGDFIKWFYIEYVEAIFGSDANSEWEFIAEHSVEVINYFKLLKVKFQKDQWPFGRYLTVAMKLLKGLVPTLFVNVGPTMDFISHMIDITEVFSCCNKFQKNKLTLLNNKDAFATINKWLHYIGNLKYSDGRYVRDSERKMPIVNLCMNLASLKIVIRRMQDASTNGLFHSISLKGVKDFILNMNLSHNTTATQFRAALLPIISRIDAAPSTEFVEKKEPVRKSTRKFHIDMGFFTSKTYCYAPMYSMCDFVGDFLIEKVINIWMESVDCAQCFEVMLETMQDYDSWPCSNLYRNLAFMFRRIEHELCVLGEIPVDLIEHQFSAFANRIINSMKFEGFKYHDHLFNSVEFGGTCHFTCMTKDLISIYLQLRILHFDREVKIGINEFNDSSLKYGLGRCWA